MFEKPPTIENKAERIPSQEEIQTLFEKITEGKEYTERRKLEDEKGVFLWEIKLPKPEGGGYIEYSYCRAGTYHDQNGKRISASTETRIDKLYTDEDEIPEDGDNVSVYTNGEWI